MRIATYNVNGINGRLGSSLEWLAETGPDIVCLREIKTDDARLRRWDAVMRPESRNAYRRLLAQGWIDSTRQLDPDDIIYTYWGYGIAFRRNQGFRMDFLLLSAALARLLKEASVDIAFRRREHASDHAPTWISLSGAVRQLRLASRAKLARAHARERDASGVGKKHK